MCYIEVVRADPCCELGSSNRLQMIFKTEKRVFQGIFLRSSSINGWCSILDSGTALNQLFCALSDIY